MRWWLLVLCLRTGVDAQAINQNIGSATGQNVGAPGQLFSGSGNNPYYGGENTVLLAPPQPTGQTKVF